LFVFADGYQYFARHGYALLTGYNLVYYTPNILPGEQFSGMEPKTNRLKGVGVQAHLHVDQFAIFGLATNVETENTLS
jgi:hypothetical protein